MSSNTVQELLVSFKEMPNLISLILNKESEKHECWAEVFWVVKRNGTKIEVTLNHKAKDLVDFVICQSSYGCLACFKTNEELRSFHDITVNILTLVRSSVTSKFCLRTS